MKLEVGQFVRLKSGYICKIINVNDFREPNMKYGVEANYLNDIMFIGDDDVVKASYSIIDLIEVGDYLNGFIVNEIERDNTNTIIKIGNSTFNVLENEEIYTPSNDKNNGYEKIEKLKSIVTHEKMEQMAYKVGE